jgi:hypothetical protein
MLGRNPERNLPQSRKGAKKKDFTYLALKTPHGEAGRPLSALRKYS